LTYGLDVVQKAKSRRKPTLMELEKEIDKEKTSKHKRIDLEEDEVETSPIPHF
jgi:hypothetical protein